MGPKSSITTSTTASSCRSLPRICGERATTRPSSAPRRRSP
jgi:hypothetical protein